MKKVLLVLLVCAVVVGFYRGWFTLSHSRDTESSKVDISLTVDPDKAKEDATMVKDKTTELGDRARDNVKSETH